MSGKQAAGATQRESSARDKATSPGGARGENRGEDRDNLTFLADAFGSAMAGRHADGLVNGAAETENGRARQILSELVGEAVARHQRLPEAITALPGQVSALRDALERLDKQQGDSAARVEEFTAGQARRLDSLERQLVEIKSSLGTVSERLNQDLADELDAVDHRLARIAEGAQRAERSQKRALAIGLSAGILLALLCGLVAGAVLAGGSAESAYQGLRSLTLG